MKKDCIKAMNDLLLSATLEMGVSTFEKMRK